MDTATCALFGQPPGNVDAVALARCVVVAVAEGATVAPELLSALADAVLDVDAVRLAMEVREGGAHAVRRAIELAALVLADRAEVNATGVDGK